MDAAAVVADCAREARRDDEGFGMREDLGLKNAGSIVTLSTPSDCILGSQLSGNAGLWLNRGT